MSQGLLGPPVMGEWGRPHNFADSSSRNLTGSDVEDLTELTM